jgi:4-aminobutyrate aminotransferase-like enzyme
MLYDHSIAPVTDLHRDEVIKSRERGMDVPEILDFVDDMVAASGSEVLTEVHGRHAELNGLRTEQFVNDYREGVEVGDALASEILADREFPWWDVDCYSERTAPIFNCTSPGQFVTVLGRNALQRDRGSASVMYAGHQDLFPSNESMFLDGLTNATVTNWGSGYPLQAVAADHFNSITGGAQCIPYHPGALLDVAGQALIAKAPIDSEGARVAWFNSGGDAVGIAIAAAEAYTERVHGENGRRKAVYFQEAYHGNIEGRAGRVTGGINEAFHPEDRNSIMLEYPNEVDEAGRVFESLRDLVDRGEVSCIVFESTQGDGGGVSMDPEFFCHMMAMSLDKQVPVVVDEVQSGFGRSGRIFDVEYLLEHWRNSPYVIDHGYPEKPPMCLAVAKSMTNGAMPGSAVVLPSEYAVLERAQGLNTFSGFPGSLAATLATLSLMDEVTLDMVRRKRELFDEEIAPFVGRDRLITGIRGNGLHLFLHINPDFNNELKMSFPNSASRERVTAHQVLQAELLGRRRMLTGTVARDSLRVHAPINATDTVWKAIGRGIGSVAEELEMGNISPSTIRVLNGQISGLAAR